MCEKLFDYFYEVSMPSSTTKRGGKPTALVPLHVIRTETVLSKLPMHNLAKRGNLNIHIEKRDEHGKIDLYWEVAPNPKFGDSRQLSYKLDTIVINQRIDQLDRPLPKLIKLGSLRDIARELGLPPSDTNNIRDAALKNAATFITAKITYGVSANRVHECGRVMLQNSAKSLPLRRVRRMARPWCTPAAMPGYPAPPTNTSRHVSTFPFHRTSHVRTRRHDRRQRRPNFRRSGRSNQRITSRRPLTKSPSSRRHVSSMTQRSRPPICASMPARNSLLLDGHFGPVRLVLDGIDLDKDRV